MKIADNVALILSRYGFSLAEGLEIYAQYEASEQEELVYMGNDTDCVVYISTHSVDPEEGRDLSVTVWLNYSADFCLSYKLAGAVALYDPYLDLDEEDTKKLLEFFQLCNDAYRENREFPDLPDDMYWIFKHSFLEDYMEYAVYDVNKRTDVKIEVPKREV